jgi:lipoprotein-releasing system permease protein
VMIVKEKQSDIAILRTMGSGARNILGIFIVQGVVIGLAGTLLGVGLGVLLSNNLEMLVHLLERILDMRFVDEKVYFISDLPARVQAADVWKVAATAFALCAVSTILPAWRAARTLPAQALRHE